MAGSWDAIKSTLKSAAKDAILEPADITILNAAVQIDKDRNAKYLALESKRKDTALQTYKSQVDQRLVKAALIPREGEKAKIIRFMFNPTELTFNRQVSITPMEGARTERGLPKVNFGFVEPYQLTLAGLLFDTYETGTSVLQEIQPILDAVDFTSFQDPFQKQDGYQEREVQVSLTEGAMQKFVQGIGGKNVLGVREYGSENIGQQALELRRPPVYYFFWGEKNYMLCMIKQLTYKLTMFLPNGTPVRAMVDITLEEVDLGVASRAFSKRQKFIAG